MVKLLAPAAALVCALVLTPTASAAVDFERQVPSAHGTLDAGRSFNLVGARWRGRALADVEFRVRRPGGWSCWAHAGAHAPGRSEGLWVGRARTVGWRLDRPVPGLRLHFVSVARERTRARGRAAQTGGLPFSYVPREEWEDGKCPPRTAPDYGEVKAVHVHHTVSLNDYTAAEAPAVVLAICRYHRNSNGWNDVGYNMLVDRFGVLYEGRAGGIDKAVVGAQAQGFNAQTSGIASIGDNRTVELGPEALSALAMWIRWKLAVHGQPLSGKVTLTSAGGSLTKYPTGARVSVQRVIGHRDTGLTECPGGALYAQLPELRALVESGSAPPVDTFATRLSAALDVDSALFGQPVVVGGTLLSGAGAVLAGESLEIQVSTENAWRTVGRATTGPDGAFSDELQPRKRMYLRVRFPGRSGLRRSTSGRLLLRLHPTIEFDEPPTRARRGRAVSLAGSVAPRKRALRLVVQRRVRGRWRKAGARTVRVRRGSFVTSFTPDRRGTWRFYAVAPSDLDTDRGASERHVLTVR